VYSVSDDRFMQVKPLNNPDQHFDDPTPFDSDGQGTRRDNARRRNRLYEPVSSGDLLAELGSVVSFQSPKHLGPKPVMFCFLPAVLAKGEINEEILIRLRRSVVTSATAWNSN
jgi:hypothetical protein